MVQGGLDQANRPGHVRENLISRSWTGPAEPRLDPLIPAGWFQRGRKRRKDKRDGTIAQEHAAQGGHDQTQLLNALCESTGLQRKDVASVLDQLGVVIERHVKRRAVGIFTLPGLVKIKVVRKPATKARKMISPVYRPGDHGGRETSDLPGVGLVP